jgi:hypothetical protein
MDSNDDFDCNCENIDEEPDADLENKYNNGKASKEDDLVAATKNFKEALA